MNKIGKLTPWFSGRVKPVRIGVYETEAYFGKSYQYWNGKWWGGYAWSVDAAATENATYKSKYQKSSWRGLAAKPRGERK